jgi:hypothetical protein
MSTKSSLQLFVVLVAGFMLLVQFAALYQGVPVALRGRAGFHALYSAGLMVRTGHGSEIYDRGRFQEQLAGGADGTLPFDRPAYEALFFVPLSLLPYRSAYIAFLVLNLGFLAVAISLLRPHLAKLEAIWRWAPSAVFVCFFPLTIALIQGEDSIFLLMLLVASAVCFYDDRDLSAGILLGLTLFKFQFALPIALLFLLWRRWRIVTGFSIVGVASWFLSLWLTGLAGFRGYLQLLGSWDLPFVRGAIQTSAYSPEICNFRCLLNAIPSSHLSPHVLTFVLAALSILLILWAATKPANFALAILVAVLVSDHALMNDAAVLVVPVAMVLDSRLGVTSGKLRLWSRNIACLIFVAPTLFFLAGISYCWLGLLLLFLLMPLRSTSNSAPPDNTWFKLPPRFRAAE